MSSANAAELALAQHLYQNAAMAGVGDVTGLPGSATAGSFYAALCTADPGTGPDQTTNETGYTGYTRVAIPRSSGGFTVSQTSGVTTITNAGTVTFPASTGGSPSTLTHFTIGTASTGTGMVLQSGALSAARTINPGFDISFAPGTLTITLQMD